MAKRSTPKSQDNATAVQAGIEKTLYDELHKGLNYAAKSLAAIDEQERLNLLSQAELAYQNAIYLSEQAHHQNRPSTNNSTNSEHSSSNKTTTSKTGTNQRPDGWKPRWTRLLQKSFRSRSIAAWPNISVMNSPIGFLDATKQCRRAALRPAVIARKTWGGHRTPAGAQSLQILVSILRTCWQHGKDNVFTQLLRSRQPMILDISVTLI